MSNILLLEDDLSLINGLSFAFKKQGFELNIARTLKEAEELWTDGKYDLLVLDVSLPDGSGFEFCKRVRLTSKVPIIFLTASDEETSIIMGLDIGGDDYITKPFSPKELVLRVNNIIKRAYRDDNNRISIDGYELDEEQRKIYADNVEIELTTKEFDLLMMFIKNKGIAFSRDKILENVWDENYFGSDRVVDDTLRRLRKKLPNLNIHTIYGYGYRLG
mgnify:CR=1 FL=1